MTGPLGVIVSPFRPTSWIKGWGPHHHVEAARHWCRDFHTHPGDQHLLYLQKQIETHPQLTYLLCGGNVPLNSETILTISNKSFLFYNCSMIYIKCLPLQCKHNPEFDMQNCKLLKHTLFIKALRIGFISFNLSSLDKGCCRFKRFRSMFQESSLE